MGAQLLRDFEGTGKPAERRAGEAFQSIRKNLYTMPFSVGMFSLMKICGVDTTRDNVQEYATALQVPLRKATSDLDTWKQSVIKMQKAEEMIRDVEIREKKKLAEQLEKKAR